MAQVKYLGEAHAISFHGYAFVPGTPVEITDASALIAMRMNRFFEVDGQPTAGEAKAAENEANQAAAAQTVASTQADPDEIVAKHRGGGSYSIMRGDAELVEKLTRADAEAFNAMTVEEQDAYIASELAKKNQ